jgi:hypothetical protein
MFNVTVIGAGMAGLVCAQQLTQAGYTVVVVEIAFLPDMLHQMG